MGILLEELRAAAIRLRLLIEGYTDLLRLNLEVSTRAAVQAHNDAAGRRIVLLNDAIACLERLTADGYPDLPCKEVNAEIRDDMAESLESLRLAFNEFCQELGASGGAFIVGPEEEQE